MFKLESAPENWWEDKEDQDHENIADHDSNGDGGDVIDFQMIMDEENDKKRSRKGEGRFDNFLLDASNATKGSDKVGKGRNTLTIDQSLFPPSESMKVLNSTLPEFSCSPIALQSSQADTTFTSKDQQTTPMCHQFDCNAMLSDLKGNMKSPPAINPSPSIDKKDQTSYSSRQSGGLTQEIKTKATLGSTPHRTSRVSFQTQPKVFLLNQSSTLSNEHTRCLRKCVNDGFISILTTKQQRPLGVSDYVDEFESGFDFDTAYGRQSFLDLMSSNRNDNSPPVSSSFYAIGTARDMNFSVGEAIIVPRTFPYYLSVACGLPIVDIEFLSSAVNMKRQGTTNHQRYPFPFLSVNDEKETDCKKHSGDNFLVLGASNYTWDAPKKARDAALRRYSLWQEEKGPHSQLETLQPGTDLLLAYTVVLIGEFDQNCHGKRTAVAKRRRQMDSNVISSEYCTRGNICLLLQLCGAKVYDIDFVSSKQIKKGLSEDQIVNVKNARPLGANNESLDSLEHDLRQNQPELLLVMVKGTSDVKVGNDFLVQLNMKGTTFPVVSCQWLLDSIGEFEVKEIRSYSN